MSQHYRLQYSAAPPPAPSFPGSNTEPYQKTEIGGPPLPKGSFFKCTCCCIFIFIIIVLIAAIVIVLFCTPKLPAINADSLRISSFNLTNSFISGTFDVEFTFINKNQAIKQIYKKLKVEVSFQSGHFGPGDIGDFRHGAQTETSVSSNFTADMENFNEQLARDLDSERSNRGFVQLKVSVRGYSWDLVPTWWPSSEEIIEAKCDGLEVVIGPNSTDGATREGSSKKCNVITLPISEREATALTDSD